MNQFPEVYEDEISEYNQSANTNLVLLKNQCSKEVLKYYKPENIHGQVIGKLVHNYYFVYDYVKISDLVDELINHENINAVGVVNNDREIIGIINRKELFDKMSKSFGRDLYKNKELKSFIKKTMIFNFKKNIFSIANILSDDLNNQKNHYYLLENDSNKFVGIFSSKDLLIYLSEMTQKDIQLAKKLQECIVKEEKVITNNNCEIVGASRMAKGVGGDFYYMHEYSKGQWLLSICDVSGKGISAALLSGIISGMTSIYDFKNGIKNFIIKLNEYIYNSFETEKFVTGIFLDYNEKTGKVSFFDVGHSYSFIFREKRLFRLVSDKSVLPFGIISEIKPEEVSFILKKDDLLILTTDGIEDQLNANGKQYGIKRVLSLLKKNSINNIKEIKNKLFKDLLNFRTSQTQNDDITLIILKRK